MKLIYFHISLPDLTFNHIKLDYISFVYILALRLLSMCVLVVTCQVRLLDSFSSRYFLFIISSGPRITVRPLGNRDGALRKYAQDRREITCVK